MAVIVIPEVRSALQCGFPARHGRLHAKLVANELQDICCCWSIECFACVNRIVDIMQYLQQRNPNTQMILTAILPRADGEAVSMGAYQWPNKYTEGIAAVNSGLEAYAATQAHVHYVDCTSTLLPDGKVCHMASISADQAMSPCLFVSQT